MKHSKLHLKTAHMAAVIIFWSYFILFLVSLFFISDTSLLFSGLKGLWKLANENFFTALAGAFAGAYGAQVIAERQKSKESTIKEIRNTNAAISISFAICNSAMTFKKQQLLSLVTNYRKQKDALLKGANAAAANSAIYFKYQADLTFFSPMDLPIEELRNLLFENISALGKPIRLTLEIFKYAKLLNGAIDVYNGLIKKHQEDGVTLSHENYFGLENAGQQNLIYSATLDAIELYTDILIRGSVALCGELTAHGKALAAQFDEPIAIDKLAINENFQKYYPDTEELRKWENGL